MWKSGGGGEAEDDGSSNFSEEQNDVDADAVEGNTADNEGGGEEEGRRKSKLKKKKKKKKEEAASRQKRSDTFQDEEDEEVYAFEDGRELSDWEDDDEEDLNRPGILGTRSMGPDQSFVAISTPFGLGNLKDMEDDDDSDKNYNTTSNTNMNANTSNSNNNNNDNQNNQSSNTLGNSGSMMDNSRDAASVVSGGSGRVTPQFFGNRPQVRRMNSVLKQELRRNANLSGVHEELRRRAPRRSTYGNDPSSIGNMTRGRLATDEKARAQSPAKAKAKAPEESRPELRKSRSRMFNKEKDKKTGGLLGFLRNTKKAKTYSKDTLSHGGYDSLHDQDVVMLPRGGVYVHTSIGPVQFGIPPETVKDTMTMSIPEEFAPVANSSVPTIFVVPRERFNLKAGVNVAEIEFPAFYNYFVLGKQITLVCHESATEPLRTILSEALQGPPSDCLYQHLEYSEFCPQEIKDAQPDLEEEMRYFQHKNPTKRDNDLIVVEEMIRFVEFDEDNEADLGNGVTILDVIEEARFELRDPMLWQQRNAGKVRNKPKPRGLVEVKIPETEEEQEDGNGADANDEMENRGREIDNVATQQEDDEADEDYVEKEGRKFTRDVETAMYDLEQYTPRQREEMTVLVSYEEAQSCEEINLGSDPSAQVVTDRSRMDQDQRKQYEKAVKSANARLLESAAKKSKTNNKSGGSIGSRSGAMESGGGGGTPPRKRKESKDSTNSGSTTTNNPTTPPRRRTLIKPANQLFKIPKFGITVLGNSHGFDQAGSTSGFVIWVNGQGVMVDPPPHSGRLLEHSGVPPKSITAIILTHCHADHDAGTFQKMITEQKVTLMTTYTIYQSFMRKYAAVSELTIEFLEKLVNFRSVLLEEPNYFNGAAFRFFYSLHSIPCIGFEVSYVENRVEKRIAYSGDTFYDPEALMDMHKWGVLSKERLDRLINFPWDCDVILHEAGVPPIHTPVEALDRLPSEYKKNIHLIHIGENAAKVARKKGFKIATPGVDSSIIVVDHQVVENQDVLDFLQLLTSMEVFQHFSVARALEMMLMGQRRYYNQGFILLGKGEPHMKFRIIIKGECKVTWGKKDSTKIIRAGDYIGELLCLRGGVQVDYKEQVVCMTKVTTIEFDKYAMNHLLLEDSKLRTAMENIVFNRVNGASNALARNPFLNKLSAAQKADLQSKLKFVSLKAGETIVEKGSTEPHAVLVNKGNLYIPSVHGEDGSSDEELSYIVPGMLVYDVHADRHGAAFSICALDDDTEVFLLAKADLLQIFDHNPYIFLGLLKSFILYDQIF